MDNQSLYGVALVCLNRSLREFGLFFGHTTLTSKFRVPKHFVETTEWKEEVDWATDWFHFALCSHECLNSRKDSITGEYEIDDDSIITCPLLTASGDLYAERSKLGELCKKIEK